MVIVSQDRKVMWTDNFLVNVQLSIEKEYQEEERVVKDGNVSVYVNYYPSKGTLVANYMLEGTMTSVPLLTSTGEMIEKVFLDLINALSNNEAVFKIPQIPDETAPTAELRYIKDKKQKKYIQVKKWAKYEKEHPITDLRKQIVRVYSV